MFEKDVRSIEDSFLYIADCNLATVVDMAMKKSRSKCEFKRQIAIAQKMVDWIRDFKIDITLSNRQTRVNDVMSQGDGNVEKYVQKYMPEFK